MLLHSIFHKSVNRNKLKVCKFQSHRLISFSAIKETVTVLEGCIFILIIVFICTHKFPI